MVSLAFGRKGIEKPEFIFYKGFNYTLDYTFRFAITLYDKVQNLKERRELCDMLYVGDRRKVFKRVKDNPELLGRLVEIVENQFQSPRIRIYATDLIMRLAHDNFDISMLNNRLEDLIFRREIPHAAERCLKAALARHIIELAFLGEF